MHLKRGSNQAPIVLGKELGRGGEGAVYPVAGAPDVVAKIYLKPPSPLKVEKLRSMARRASPALLRVAAWPLDLLIDHSGAVRGFLMPKVSAREDVHELYSPKSRRRAFPNADFRFVVRVATNIARAFAQVHAVGNVIGDVNHGNALVGRDGTVVLIDCDSFQVRDGVRVFSCDVGVPLFTPPELAGQSFRGLKRNAGHDGFGLAVLLFHLLYIGRHPFAGKHVDGEMPIERAIAESRFAYGRNAAHFGMTRPPGTVPLESLGAEIAQHFERAFEPPGENPRPTASQWVEALQRLEAQLEACSSSAGHFYPPGPGGPDGGGAGCCWCAFERTAGFRLFGTQRDSFDLRSLAKLAPLWDAIVAVTRPESVARLEVPREAMPESENPDPLGPVPRSILCWLLVFLAAGCFLYQPGKHVFLGLLTLGASLWLRWRFRNQSHAAESNFATRHSLLLARKHLNRITDEWNKLVEDARFEELLEELGKLKEQLVELPKGREARMKALITDAEQLQRHQYLDRIRLDQARLPNVSQQEIAMLAAFDVDTAAEVLALRSDLKGTITRAAHDELLAWAKACERNFKFDPKRGADPKDVQRLDAALLQRQEGLLNTLRDGQRKLESLSTEISEQRATKQGELDMARKAVKAALQALPNE